MTARTACPDFINWTRTRRITEGFRTNRLAPLLDEGARSLLRPWFEATARLMFTQRHVRDQVDKAIATITGFQTDVTKLKNDTALRAVFEPLETTLKQFKTVIEAYKEALKPLIKPLKDSVAEKSVTTGWADLVALGRKAADLEAELREAAAVLCSPLSWSRHVSK